MQFTSSYLSIMTLLSLIVIVFCQRCPERNLAPDLMNLQKKAGFHD
jgi:hypothetical protein